MIHINNKGDKTVGVSSPSSRNHISRRYAVMTENEPTKRCTKCQEMKPFSEFSKNSRRPDGLVYWCKVCVNEYARIYRLENKEKVAESARLSNQKYKNAILINLTMRILVIS